MKPAAALVLLLALLASCTLVYIEGDGNSVSDTGGHGTALSLPKQSLSDRLKNLQQNH